MISQAVQIVGNTHNRTSRQPQGRLIGYPRFPSCDRIIEDHGSGASTVPRARLAHLLEVIEVLAEKGAIPLASGSHRHDAVGCVPAFARCEINARSSLDARARKNGLLSKE